MDIFQFMVFEEVLVEPDQLSHVIIKKLQKNFLILLCFHTFELLISVTDMIDRSEFPLLFWTEKGLLPFEILYELGRIVSHFLIRR